MFLLGTLTGIVRNLKNVQKILNNSNNVRTDNIEMFPASLNLLRDVLTIRENFCNWKIVGGKEIVEQISKPRFLTEFENRAFFLPAAYQRRKARDF